MQCFKLGGRWGVGVGVSCDKVQKYSTNITLVTQKKAKVDLEKFVRNVLRKSRQEVTITWVKVCGVGVGGWRKHILKLK